MSSWKFRPSCLGLNVLNWLDKIANYFFALAWGAPLTLGLNRIIDSYLYRFISIGHLSLIPKYVTWISP